MEFLAVLHFVAVILEESIELLPKNGKLVALITTLTLLLFSAFFLMFRFSSQSLLNDMLVKQSSFPSTMEDFQLIMIVNVSYHLFTFIIRYFPETAIVILSAISYSGKNLSLKELLLQIVRTWIRPFVTGFFTTLFALGFVLFISVLASPILVFSGTFVLRIAIFLGLAAHIFGLYLSVVWVMASVISVIEQNSYGIKTIAKAEAIFKGKKLHGFILNIGFSLLSLILFQGSRSIMGDKWLRNHVTVFWLIIVNCSCLQMMFQLVYSVLSFYCKKYNGEEVEMQGTFSYNKLSSAPQVDNIVPYIRPSSKFLECQN